METTATKKTAAKKQLSPSTRKPRTVKPLTTQQRITIIGRLLSQLSAGKSVLKSQIQAALPEADWLELEKSETSSKTDGSSSNRSLGIKLSRYRTAKTKAEKALSGLKTAMDSVPKDLFEKPWTVAETQVLTWKAPELRSSDAGVQQRRRRALAKAQSSLSTLALTELGL